MGADNLVRLTNIKVGADNLTRTNIKMGADNLTRTNIKVGADYLTWTNIKVGADNLSWTNIKVGADNLTWAYIKVGADNLTWTNIKVGADNLTWTNIKVGADNFYQQSTIRSPTTTGKIFVLFCHLDYEIVFSVVQCGINAWSNVMNLTKHAHIVLKIYIKELYCCIIHCFWCVMYKGYIVTRLHTKTVDKKTESVVQP